MICLSKPAICRRSGQNITLMTTEAEGLLDRWFFIGSQMFSLYTCRSTGCLHTVHSINRRNIGLQQHHFDSSLAQLRSSRLDEGEKPIHAGWTSVPDNEQCVLIEHLRTDQSGSEPSSQPRGWMKETFPLQRCFFRDESIDSALSQLSQGVYMVVSSAA